MRIIILDRVEGDTIAREDASDGAFFVRSDGTVWYRNVADSRELFVNENRETFSQSAIALNRYSSAVLSAVDEAGELVAVDELRNDLRRVGCLIGRDGSFWPVILEQAEAGTL